MLRVFDKFTKDFSGNGLAVLNDARNVKIHREINGECTLSFEYPQDEKWRHLSSDNIILTDSGQRFRISRLEERNVSAVPIYKDAAGKHLPSTADWIGFRVPDIVQYLFEGTEITVLTEEEVAGLGMEWVTDLTDYFAQSRITPIGGLISLMETLDKYKIHNELYFDNYKIALVRQIGRDKGKRIDLSFNSNEIKPVIDTSEIVTRLYPYGKNGLEITAVNEYGNAFIDSPNKDKFIQHEGFVNFDEIDDPEELLLAAQALFSEENPDRVDIPKYSVSCNCLQDGYEIGLGDTVTVNDTQYGVVSKQRVVAVDYYPYEPNKTKITVGTPTTNLQDVIDHAEYTYVNTKLNTNERGELKTSWLEMMQHNESISVNEDLRNQEIALYKTGSLYVSPDGSAAVAIIKGRLAVADNKDVNGNWNWTTVMDAGKVLVNEVFTGTLHTELVQILSDNGSLRIEDSLITMKDASGTLRFQTGYDEKNEQYIFALYDNSGRRTAYLDDSGNLVIRGTFKTGEDGENRIVIDGNGLTSYNGNNRKHGVEIVSLQGGENSGNSTTGSLAAMALNADGQQIFSIDSYYFQASGFPIVRFRRGGTTVLQIFDGSVQMMGPWTYSNGATGSFSTKDGKIVMVSGGLVTGIMDVED